MFQLENKTDFAASLLPTMDPDGGEAVMVVVKATYTFLPNGELSIAKEQVPLFMKDQYNGESGESSLLYANDLAPEKKGTDVVFIGSAIAPKPNTTEFDVTLKAGTLKKTLRVFGDRAWQAGSFGSRRLTDPSPIKSVPLTYEKAFGGEDKSHEDENEWAFEPRNPAGNGFIANPKREDINEVSAPNIEDPGAIISDIKERPQPAGFGFIAPNWEPRKKYAGTYDESWQKSRCPLLPTDFDPKFYNAAHPDLISCDFFQGGEAVEITNVTKNGVIRFSLPAFDIKAKFYIDGAETEQACQLDTVIIEPDERRLMLTWRSKFRCHRKMKYVNGALVTGVERTG